jgi:hypothetical protein
MVAIGQVFKISKKSEVNFSHSSHQTDKKAALHTQKTQLHFSRMYLYLSTAVTGHKQETVGFLHRKQPQVQLQTPQSV